jgi:hypothetical protein
MQVPGVKKTFGVADRLAAPADADGGFPAPPRRVAAFA